MIFGIRRAGALSLALLVALARGNVAHAQNAPSDPVDAAAIGSTFSPELLNGLPSSRNVYPLLETAEGEVTSDRFYGGGLNVGRPARDGALLASWTQTQFFVGDVNVTDPAGGAPFFFPVLGPWDRVDVGSALMPLGTNASGLAVSLTPLSPAATWTTTVDVSGTPPGLVAGPSTRVAPPIETLTQFTHGGLLVSGPLSPRTGVVAAVDWSGSRQVERSGPSQADGQAASAFVHVVFRPNASDTLRTIGWVQRTHAPFAGAAALHEPAAADQTLFTHVQTTWERTGAHAASWRVFGAYSEADASRVDGSPSAPVVERLIDGPVGLLVESGDRTDRQWSAGARATIPHGAHVLLAGVDGGRASTRIGPPFHGLVGETIDGARARLWDYLDSAGDARRHITTVDAFVADRITLGAGRTLEAGVAYDLASGAADGALTGITWQNLLPRVALRWRQHEVSHVTWVAGYRRSSDRLTTDTLAVGDPAAPRANVASWTAAGAGPFLFAVGPGTGSVAGFASIDPSLRRPVTDEVAAGIDVQLTPNIRGRITGVAKRTRHLMDLVDLGTSASGYTVSTIVDGRPASDGGDALLPVYSRVPGIADRYLLTTMSGDDTASGVGLVLNSEAVVNRLTLMFNATASITDGPAAYRGFRAEENDLGIGETASDLNAQSFDRGRLFYDRAFTLKLSGVYQFPRAITFSAIARYQDGQPFSRVTVVPGATTNLQTTQGTEFVRAYAAGDARFMYTGTLDVRLAKQVRAGRAVVDVFVEGYNVINMGNEVEERVVTGPGFRDITAIQPPAVAQVGLRLHF